MSPARHDELHQNAINVYLPERDGIRLTAARTLALDQTWRQLNVRRLVTMIRRVLYRQMQWAVFEPNNQQLRFQMSRMLESYLRQLYRANAFTGATESQAFFVKCDDELNPLAVRTGGPADRAGRASRRPSRSNSSCSNSHATVTSRSPWRKLMAAFSASASLNLGFSAGGSQRAVSQARSISGSR